MRGICRISIVLLLATASAGATALETDQFYAWGRPLEDATAILNAKVNLEIDSTLRQINQRPRGRRMGCHQVVRAISRSFRIFIFHDIELWASNSELVPRLPGSATDEERYHREYLLHDTNPLDIGIWIPPSPTIRLHDVRLGADKLSHFFSEGWYYYSWYRRAHRGGRSVEEAERIAMRRGLLVERTLLGLASSGVLSLADLEANHRGMHFLVGLCAKGDPELQRSDDGWRLSRPFDFRDYVTPEWDESYQPSIYSQRRWKKVRPIILRYCDQLAHPEVAAQRAGYARRDGETPTERLVRGLVQEGKLPDPREYSIARVCAGASEP